MLLYLEELKKTKSPVRKCRYPEGYETYVVQQIRIRKMLSDRDTWKSTYGNEVE